MSDDDEESENGQKLAEWEIVAILKKDEYSSCLICKEKVQDINEVNGEYVKCKAEVKMSKYSKNGSVKITVEVSNGRIWYLAAFNKQVAVTADEKSGSSMEER